MLVVFQEVIRSPSEYLTQTRAVLGGQMDLVHMGDQQGPGFPRTHLAVKSQSSLCQEGNGSETPEIPCAGTTWAHSATEGYFWKLKIKYALRMRPKNVT